MNQELIEEQHLKIKDLYEGAYLLCRGFHLKDLTIIGSNGRKIAFFIFTGDGIRESSEEYRLGRATANVAMLKFGIDHLKDRMFKKLRELENAPGAKEKEKNICSDYQKPIRSNETIESKI